MSEKHIEKHSCLLEEQHGYEKTEAMPLSDKEARKVVEEAVPESQEASASGRVSRPRIDRLYQAKAATYKPRSWSQIDSILIHTPEGYEGGTLSVLQQGRAGFDWYLPPSGNLYRCNDFSRYVAWQAGSWPYNLRSIGIEQWDFAGNMANAPDAHYRRLANLVAWLCQLLDIPVRHANYGQPGLIAHAQVTPRKRTDPGRGFDWDRLIRYTRANLGSGGGGQPETLYRVISGSFSSREYAEARARALQGKGFSTYFYRHEGSYRVQVGSFSERGGAEAFVAQLRRAGFESFVVAD